ncbi:probable pectin methylesterase CGR2 [Malania oleifera]|uniref:probable pectin methylesterase CGR2 n=1 Tax=Malania oleifera TaxID=397392 RepID=UPI0025AEAC78|nr:probable pectin methylesterase CGR2 [Malania oleifera]
MLLLRKEKYVSSIDVCKHSAPSATSFIPLPVKCSPTGFLETRKLEDWRSPHVEKKTYVRALHACDLRQRADLDPSVSSQESQPLSSSQVHNYHIIMARRQVNPARRIGDGGSIPFAGTLHSKSRPSPLLSIGLVLVGAFLLIAYSYSGSGGSSADKESLSKVDGSISCTLEVQRALPILKKVYGDSMHKVLHVGPDTCSVVSKLLKEEDTEPWGVEPYEIDDADSNCKSLVRKGIVRVADIKFPLPYRAKSFSLIIVSDALDYLSPKYLNKTLPELARVSADGFIIFAGYPGQHRAKVAELSKFGRPAKLRSSSWWIRYFVQTRLEENETAMKKFEQASSKRSYKPACQVFHLKSSS